MRKEILIVFVAIGLIAVSCSSTEEKMKSAIKEQESAFFASQPGDQKLATPLINSYIEFADNFPGDKEAPEFLFKAADISMNMNRPRQAINLFKRILDEYPDFDKLPQCLFLQGFIYENNIGDLQKAKEIYTEFLKKYPDDDFADDAKVSLENLGRSPEELIKEFEKKAQENKENNEKTE